MVKVPWVLKTIKFTKKRPYEYNADGYYIVDNKLEHKTKKTKVTVITPVFNAEKYLRRTIDSVINQTMGFENIEYLLVDDCSTDSSRDILLEYSSKYENIFAVFLECNTGTPGQPRNLGVQLSTSKYITFLDADDWLEPNGLEVLHDILEKTGDDYVVGKTIQLKNDGSKIVGEHESCKERRNVSPYSIPHIFQHLGPRARMVRASVIKENRIVFPEMKFAEDKQFFMDVLIHCNTISTTKAPIYYLNRLDDNDASLTKQTNIMQKTDSNIKVIHYILQKNLEPEKEKMIMNRLYEFDSITRLFNTGHFQKTKLKQLYYNKFNEILKTTNGLRYDITENFHNPLNKVAFELFKEGKTKQLEKLFEWEKKEKVKNVLIKDNLPYYVAPFLDEKHQNIRVPMLAIFKEDQFYDNKYILDFTVYGDYVDRITDVIIRDREDVNLEYSFPVEVDRGGEGRLVVDMELLKQLPSSSYSMFLRYDDYNKINIRKMNENQIRYENRDFTFYTTIHSNVGLKVQ
ncbi:glycosyltransferase family 2 protein [Bacillus sp. 31A1R]|uniref:Glycosyltransferase family 2 protein n=1 Tax=Robertmurraya mangrovi TaxID=3098077 RepID=A0ABU5IYZ8_9BACI|nr:glycosyltransferase family 2 protein [Bacillus sp. 31A1R]MDZ5472361.1 glycosyltransferase family 2 protein [Bacillus sp. 31A1R]